MLNIIWLVLLVGSAAVAVFTGQVKEVVLAATESAGSAFKLALGFTGIMALWLGLMRIAETKRSNRSLYPVDFSPHAISISTNT